MRLSSTLRQSEAKHDMKSSQPLAWEGLVGNVLVGRDLVGSDPGGSIRGPIARVEIVGTQVRVELEWSAVNILDFEGDPTDEWEKHSICQTTYAKNDIPHLRTDGAITIYTELDALNWTSTVILPAGDNLSPSRVQGL